jgi:hypothetical protein
MAHDLQANLHLCASLAPGRIGRIDIDLALGFKADNHRASCLYASREAPTAITTMYQLASPTKLHCHPNKDDLYRIAMTKSYDHAFAFKS